MNSVRIVCSVSHIPALQMYIVVTIYQAQNLLQQTSLSGGAYTHTHTHMHARPHAHTHTCTHDRTHAHTHTHTHTHTSARAFTRRHSIVTTQDLIYTTTSTDNKETLEADEDSSAEWKTRQVCRLGKRNVWRFDLKESERVSVGEDSSVRSVSLYVHRHHRDC